MLPLRQQIIQELLACHNTPSHIQSPAHASETSPLEALGRMCSASMLQNAGNPGCARVARSSPGCHLCGGHMDPHDADQSVKRSHLGRSLTGQQGLCLISGQQGWDQQHGPSTNPWICRDPALIDAPAWEHIKGEAGPQGRDTPMPRPPQGCNTQTRVHEGLQRCNATGPQFPAPLTLPMSNSVASRISCFLSSRKRPRASSWATRYCMGRVFPESQDARRRLTSPA